MINTDRYRPILFLALAKIAVALAVVGRVILEHETPILPPLILLGPILAGSAVATAFLSRGNRDARTVYLGYACLLLAAAFTPADTFGLHLRIDAPFSRLLFLLANLRIEVFLLPFLALIVREDAVAGSSFEDQQHLGRWVRLAWVAAAGLLVLHLVWLLQALRKVPLQSLEDPTQRPTLLVMIVLGFSALVFLVRRRGDEADDRQPGRPLVLAVVGGGAVLLTFSLIWLIAGPNEGSRQLSAVSSIAWVVFNVVVLIAAVVLMSAVLAKRIKVSDWILDQAHQPALARLLVGAVVAAPLVALAAYLYQNREAQLQELFSAQHLLFPILGALGAVALLMRHHLLEALEERLFPERYQARQVLDQLPGQIRGARDAAELAQWIEQGLVLAWGLDRVALFLRDRGREELIDARRELSPLALDSQIATWATELRRPFEIDLGEDAALRRLPVGERHWLVDGRVRLLAPAFSLDGQLNALIVLGTDDESRQFLSEDRQLLAGITAPTGLVVELLELKENEPRGEGSGEILGMSEELLSSQARAAECLSCGRVYPPGTPVCRQCGLELAESLVPYALRRMFRFDERLGTGGMAVVYRATDLKLGRPVAIKTLPRVAPEAALRLQREARTAATVSHPGLANIFGIETWKGTPMVILELLEGGTLSDRMAEGPVDPLEVVETGQVVARALEAIHKIGILHRDVKPSNIGYTRYGAPKLLDFGIARIYEDLRASDEDPSEVLTLDGAWNQSDNVTGTICYFSPEALNEAPPDPSFDLWSLAVVLYEALTGTNLFFARSLKSMVDKIRSGDVPDLRRRLPGCPDELAEFFKVELHPDKGRRSQSGGQFHRRLERVRRLLVIEHPASQDDDSQADSRAVASAY